MNRNKENDMGIGKHSKGEGSIIFLESGSGPGSAREKKSNTAQDPT